MGFGNNSMRNETAVCGMAVELFSITIYVNLAVEI
jgi:hypothetical protein